MMSKSEHLRSVRCIYSFRVHLMTLFVGSSRDEVNKNLIYNIYWKISNCKTTWGDQSVVVIILKWIQDK
jgi:hypothetical protein